MQLTRLWIGLGGLLGATAVAAAAYGAHATVDPARVRAISAAVQMQGWHALALVACGVWGAVGGGWPVHVAGTLFIVGTALFAGAVWVPQFGGPFLGPVAPVGGTLLMVGWVFLALSATVAVRGVRAP